MKRKFWSYLVREITKIQNFEIKRVEVFVRNTEYHAICVKSSDTEDTIMGRNCGTTANLEADWLVQKPPK